LATARELLEQADALMRRNRLREAGAAGVATDFPVLTEVVAAGGGERPGPSILETRLAAEAGADALVPQPAIGAPRTAAVPVLTEIVDDFEPISIMGGGDDAAGAEQWPDFDDGAITISEAGQVAGDAAPAAAPEVTGTAAGAPTLAAAPVADDPDAARWNTLAEEVRMQVLQRIDIFTDTGLQEQLTARLQPIVDRASADLVATINQQVGQLLRGYVAEAIEREIEKWRHGDAS